MLTIKCKFISWKNKYTYITIIVSVLHIKFINTLIIIYLNLNVVLERFLIILFLVFGNNFFKNIDMSKNSTLIVFTK
jgi:hypothetical protein